ncbi:MAG: DivIVA domain-containing protein [Bifidobacterium choerinum]
MAQEREATGGTANIERVGKRKKGYDVRQVDAFLEQAHALYEQDGVELRRGDIQDASFDIVKGGYSIPQVDATLERLAKAVSDKDTSYEIAELGRVAWKAQVEALYRQLEAHAERADGERFAPGEPKRPSYDRKQVDRLIDRIIDQAGDELEYISTEAPDGGDDGSKLTAQSVSDVMFTQRKGKHGYDERQVDYYLNACADLLGRLESYGRVSTYAEQRPAAAAQAATPAPAVAPLIPEHADAPRTVASTTQPMTIVQPTPAPAQPSAATEPIAPEQSFDELYKAEQAIFMPTTPTVSPVTSASASATATSTVSVSDAVAAAAAAAGASVAASGRHDDADRDTTQTQSFDMPLVPHEPARTSPVARAHTLSDIKPITPAPRTIPERERTTPTPPAVPDDLNVSPTVTAVSDETTITFGDDASQPALDSPSLAALASLAKSTETLPERPQQLSATTSSGLSVPKLANLTIPDLPVRRPMDAGTDAASLASGHDASGAGQDMRFVPPEPMNVEIPNLEFPTFSTDGPLVPGDTDKDGR